MTANAQGARSLGAAGAAAIVLALAMQAQMTLPFGVDGLRIGAGDILVGPLAAIFLAIATVRRDRIAWCPPATPYLLFAMTLVLIGALVIGRIEIGHWTPWALVNRFAGWFVLIAYFLSGASISRNGGGRALDKFALVYLVALAATVLLHIVPMALAATGIAEVTPRLTGHNGGIAQLAGFLDNPNAFAMALLLGSAIAFAYAPAIAERAGPWLPWALLTCMTTGLWFTTSRAAWIAWLAMALAAVAMRALPWRATGLALIATGAICYALAGAAGGATGTAEDKVLSMFGASPNSNPLAEAGDVERLRTVDRTLDLWRQEPIFGAGLGSYLAIQEAEDNGRAIVIHSTGLWLLVETGLVGVAVFFGAFTTILIGVWRRASGATVADDRPFHRCTLFFLIGFAVMSLGHDLLYQRVLWLVLGLALAIPRTDRLPRPELT